MENYNEQKEQLATQICQLIDKFKLPDFEKYDLLKELSEKCRENNDDKNEPILDPINHKFTILPIKYPTIWKLYKVQRACDWNVEEIDFSGDREDFDALNDDEKHFIEMQLAFFSQSDGIVNFNLSERFTREVQITEAIVAYQYQTMMENIHGETYSLMLENIISDEAKRNHLFNAIQTVPSIKMMADWALRWIDSSASFAHRLVAFAIVEGVFFSGAFAAIFWLKKYKNTNRDKSKSFMKGLCISNKLIARDEGLHCTFACEMYKLLNKKLPTTVINSMFREATAIAKNFYIDAIPVRLIGMNAELMGDYIEYVADRIIVMLGYKKIFGKKNPFKFMETIGLDDKTNFFEEEASAYQNAHVMKKSQTNGDNVQYMGHGKRDTNGTHGQHSSKQSFVISDDF